MLTRNAVGWLSWVVTVLLCSWTELAAAQQKPEQRSLGFSNLVFRVDRGDEIGIADEDFRIHILEDLRRRGLKAVGAENLVFGNDRGGSAELVLGGTISELECKPGAAKGQISCRMGVEWQVLDVAADVVVYKVTTRGLVMNVAKDPPKRLGRQLILSTLNSLTVRPQFQKLLQREPSRAPTQGYNKATFKACRVGARTMPAASEQVLDATVLVQVSGGFGSGFLVSSDGFVLTAAHVVTGSAATIRLRDSREFPATVIRIDRRLDVALLRLGVPEGTSLPCLPVKLDPSAVGTDAYAIGTPASRELSFSLARGIVSGVRLLDGVQYLQTDAAVNRGNSGGPLVNGNAEAVAVVSSKLVGLSVEGIAFGAPLGAAFNVLGLAPADGFTSPELTSAGAVAATPVRQAFVDQPDSMPDLNPALSKEEQAAAGERGKGRSSGKTVFLAIGGGVLASGLMFVVVGGTNENENMRDMGWVLSGIGGAGLLISLAFD